MGWGYVFSPAVGALLASSTGPVHRFSPFVAHAVMAAASIACAVRLSHPVRTRLLVGDYPCCCCCCRSDAAAGEIMKEEERILALLFLSREA